MKLRVRCVKFSTDLYDAMHSEEEIMRRNTEPECEVVDEQPEPAGENSQLDEENQREQQDSRYPRRQSKLPTHLNDYVIESDDISCTVDYCYTMTLDEMPKTYAEAVSSDEGK